MSDKSRAVRPTSSAADIDAFIKQAGELRKSRGRSDNGGRLVFALDATASRQPTWDSACEIQNQMFEAAASVGGLQIQLCFYRGFREARFSQWLQTSEALHRAMRKVHCAGGLTQITRLLRHTLETHRSAPVNALVFVGDCVEENPDLICDLAGQLGLQQVPVFVFQEGYDPDAEPVFREVARLSGGAYCRFDQGSARQLGDLLSAVAVYAAGGHRALQDFTRQRPALAPVFKQLTVKRS